MEIITNNHWHDFTYGYELTHKEKRKFDWMDDIDGNLFVRYKGEVIALDEFMRIDPDEFMRIGPPVAPHAQRDGWEHWHGYHADTFFSATLIRLSDDGEQYQIGQAFS